MTDYVKKLIKIYLQAESEIVNEIARLRRLGLADYHVVAALKRVQAILNSMRSESWKYVPKMIEQEFYVRHPEARLQEMALSAEEHAAAYRAALELAAPELLKVAPELTVSAPLTAEQTDIMQRLTVNFMSELDAASEHVMRSFESVLVGRREDDIFRRVGMELSQLAEAEGSNRGMINRFVQELQREGVTAYIDTLGRHWSLYTYSSMALRTTQRQAEVLSAITEDAEHDLYKIVAAADPCGVCAAHAGRVYSKSGTSPYYPPLTDAFGKVDPLGADNLSNSWLNLHPNCRCAIIPWTEAGLDEAELKKIRDKSNPAKNPYDVDPRTEKQIKMYRQKQAARRRYLDNYRQWERYREAMPNIVPKTFTTFEKHKLADDDKYNSWVQAYRGLTRSDN